MSFIAAATTAIERIALPDAVTRAGIAFLGSQGDVWDAQKDMLMDTFGAISALILFGFGQVLSVKRV